MSGNLTLRKISGRLFLMLAIGLWCATVNVDEVKANHCGGGDHCTGGNQQRFRACPYDPPGLEVTRGVAGHCSVGEEVIGDCITDDDCFLKRLGNVCCYSRCLGITQCHRFP